MKNLHATISNRPTQEFEGSIGVTAGEYEQIGVTAVLSGPLSDQVQARLAGYFNNDSGYIDNSIGKDKRADDTKSVRAMLNVDFNDDTSLLLIGQHTDIDTRGGVFHSRASKIDAGGDYVIADASLTYYSPSESLEVSLFVHNFTDEEPLTYSYDITGFGNYTIQTFGPPRWVGGRVKYSF